MELHSKFEPPKPSEQTPAYYPAHSKRARRREKQKQWEHWLDRHRRLYGCYIRRYGRVLAETNKARDDIRYWEARICEIDVDEMSQFLWFFRLNDRSRMHLAMMTRELRRFDRDREITPEQRKRRMMAALLESEQQNVG